MPVISGRGRLSVRTYLYYADCRGAEGIHARKELEFDSLRPLFKRVTGQSFITHLNHLRIAKSEALLATTDKALVVEGQEVGFCDQPEAARR